MPVAQATRVKRVPGFLSDDDINALHHVATVARAGGNGYTPQATLERQEREGGRTVWINHYLALMLPDLHSRMLQAARDADAELWGGVLEEREMLSIRSVEYHTVLGEGGVAMAPHADYGSLVTIDFMLSDTDEFAGGRLQTLEPDGQMLPHPFERGDALFFLSHKYHGVSRVEAGRRNIIVAEIWEGLPRICPQRCDQPWLPCYCSYAPFTLYERHARGAYVKTGISDIERLRVEGLEYYRKEREAAELEEAVAAEQPFSLSGVLELGVRGKLRPGD